MESASRGRIDVVPAYPYDVHEPGLHLCTVSIHKIGLDVVYADDSRIKVGMVAAFGREHHDVGVIVRGDGVLISTHVVRRVVDSHNLVDIQLVLVN